MYYKKSVILVTRKRYTIYFAVLFQTTVPMRNSNTTDIYKENVNKANKPLIKYLKTTDHGRTSST